MNRSTANTYRVPWIMPCAVAAVAAVAICAVFGSAPAASAAIILQKSAGIPLPQGDLVQYTISAVGTNGEVNMYPFVAVNESTEEVDS